MSKLNDKEYILLENVSEQDRYTGRIIECGISNIVYHHEFPDGLKEDYCILSLININRICKFY